MFSICSTIVFTLGTLVTVLLWSGNVKAADDDWERFQLWNECKPMPSLVEWRDTRSNVGDNSDFAQLAVNMKLADLSLYDPSELNSFTPLLYVGVVVTSVFYKIDLRYYKPMTDAVTGLSMTSSAWGNATFGLLDEGEPGSVVVEVLERIDEFSDEYFRVNASVCH